MLVAMDEQQADVVYAVRRARAGETAFKRGTAKAFYRILFKLSEIEIPLDTGDFRLMSRRALDALLALPEQARFIRGMVAWVGFKQVPILYDRAERHAGETNYPLRKMMRLAVDAITGFSTAPLRFASHVGLWLAAAAMLLLGYIAIGFFTGTAIQGWTSLMLVVVILGAVQMFVLGMIGEYLGRLYIEAKRRPLYIVAEIAGNAGGRPALGHVATPASVTPRGRDPSGTDTIAASETPGVIGRRPIACRSSAKIFPNRKLTGPGGSVSSPPFLPTSRPASRAPAATGKSRLLNQRSISSLSPAAAITAFSVRRV